MQGINVFTNATARDAAITAPAEGQFAFTKDNNSLWYYDGAAWVASGATGDIEGVIAGVGISGGGTSGTVTVTNSMATAIDAKGDLVPGTGADTFARLAVGANDTVLTADSSTATGLKWASVAGGSMTQLATGTLTGSLPSISSISGSYKHLELFVTDPYGTGANIINIRFNSDSGANYARQLVFSSQPPSVTGTSSATSINTYNGIITTANENGYFHLILPFYTTTASAKPVQFFWTRTGASGATEQLWGSYNSTSAISSIQFFLDGGTQFSGGTYTLFGVN
jgi:hypothetical protein